METFFVDVILPLAVPQLYTYRVPLELNNQVEQGKRVIVQFGKSKFYTALIRQVHQKPPVAYQAKYIEDVLDKEPILHTKQFEFWEWLWTYYLCNPGDIMQAALPAYFKLSSVTNLTFNIGFEKEDELSDDEYVIYEALKLRMQLTLEDVNAITGKKSSAKIVKSLLEKGVAFIREELTEKYKPKLISYIKLHDDYEDEEQLKKLFMQLEKKAHKQVEALLVYLKLNDRYKNPVEVKKADLVKEAGEAPVASLIKKDIFIAYSKEKGRISDFTGGSFVSELSENQQQAYKKIKEDFTEKDVCLLHGVTSSGKTEIFVQLIKECIAENKQVLYLLPEIALTEHIIGRLKKHFGNDLIVYHSRFSDSERVEIWNTVLSQTSGKKVIVGARSAVFLPFHNLGLVIVDEEHDNSFKQFDPAPRYNARDASIYLAHLFKAKTLLGSATPSIESYYNASSGKYGFAELTKRHGGALLPEILVADIKEANKRKQMKGMFSPLLLEKINETLSSKKQVILFQNRRGFAPVIECDSCAWVPGCVNCDVSLTYHKVSDFMRCHYCGYTAKTPKVCGACGDSKLVMKGFGTEKVEEELAVHVPVARVSRMDLDTTRSKNSHARIMNEFEDRNIDILVGTQMVTKGLDFSNVGLVGILNADKMLNFPDFRAFERSYQVMAQVAGRAGRKGERGTVVIQTYNPDHSIVKAVIANNYTGMYADELPDRLNFHYPPYYRLIQFTLQCKDQDLVSLAAKQFFEQMGEIFGKRILGPQIPVIARVKNQYLRTLLLKLEKGVSIGKAKEAIHDKLLHFRSQDMFKGVRIIADVDPY